MRVLFTTNVPSPYRVDFFNELGKLCELTVLFETKSAKSRDSEWMSGEIANFKGVFLKGIRVGEAEAFCPEVVKYLTTKKFDVIVVGFYSSPTGMFSIEYMMQKKIPFILSSDGGMKRKDGRIRHQLKSHFIAAASAWLSTGAMTTEYLCFYGAKPEKVYVYPFSSIKSQDILERPLTKQQKIALRKQLNVIEDRVVLSVGQFIPRKGYDVLLKSCGRLPKTVGIYVVGGEPTEEYIHLKDQYNLSNVHFVGFQNKKCLAEYYKAADLFVLPTREDIWGLVINEAMAYGLPVITTDKCVAGVEMIRDNGHICHVNADWSSEIMQIFNDKSFLLMQQRSLQIAKKYSVEMMAEKHMDVFRELRGEKLL